MTDLFVLRHGPTGWNRIGRIQGRRDVPLSPAGVRQVRGWRLPVPVPPVHWVSGPLARCMATARLLGREPVPEPCLIEMHWGAWEGRELPALRLELGAEMAALEARGLDFRPPGGESPREVQDRLRPWLAALAARGEATLAVTHKGVIRALYALANGWDMTAKPRVRLRNTCLHHFTLAPDGTPGVAALNLPLLPPAPP